MTGRRRLLTAALFGVLGVLASCDVSSTPVFNLNLNQGQNPVNGASAGVPVFVWDEVRAEVTQLDTVHRLGITECPQDLGILTFHNSTHSEAIISISLSSPAPLAAVPFGEFEVMPDSYESVAIRFTCESVESFATTVDLELHSVAGDEVVSVPVHLAVWE